MISVISLWHTQRTEDHEDGNLGANRIKKKLGVEFCGCTHKAQCEMIRHWSSQHDHQSPPNAMPSSEGDLEQRAVSGFQYHLQDLQSFMSFYKSFFSVLKSDTEWVAITYLLILTLLLGVINWEPLPLMSTGILSLDVGSYVWNTLWRLLFRGFPESSVAKESACNAGDPGSIPGSGRSAGKGISYPLQYSWASQEVVQLVKNLPAMRETWVQFLC